MTSRHAAVWIDHKEAKIFHVVPEGFDVEKVKAPHQHVTRKQEGQGRVADREPFFHEVATALAGSEEILVVGPSSGKLDFIKHVNKHDAGLTAKIVGVETLDHPSDGQIVAYVRHYFEAKDHMLGDAR